MANEIKKITIPSGTTYSIVDEGARSLITSLQGGMVFKGTLGTSGTITTLPAASSSNKGYVYKVITAGTYQSIACKVGDLVVSDGTAWVLIPSSREGTGTVTNIATGTGLTGGPITTTGTISVDTNTIATVNALNNKMDKTNPTGTGSFSLNRKADTTIGNHSFAEGWDTTASGEASHAEGYITTAFSDYSHAEGSYTTASANYSHAEGGSTTASALGSHAEGSHTTASGKYSHAEGSYTTASADYQHVQGKYNIEDTNGTYVDIIGYGISSARKNIEATTTAGDKRLKGDVYVGCNDDSTGGSKLATEAYAASVGPVTSVNGSTGAVTIADATTSTHGLMSTADKTKLNGIASGAEVNQNAFSNIKVGSATIAADAKTDTVELVAGNNITLTPDATNDKVTITATNTDTKVASSASTNAADYPILLNNGVEATTNSVLFKAGATLNPNTGNLAVTSINGSTLGNSPKFTDTVTTVTVSGSGNAITTMSASNGAITAKKETTFLTSAQKGVASGVAELDSTGKVPASQLPSFVDDVIEGYYYNGKFYKESAHTTEITGESGKIYVDLSTNKTYRWGGSAYAEISAGLALGETSTTAYRGDRGAAAYNVTANIYPSHTHNYTPAGTVSKPTITVTPSTTYIKASASGTAVAAGGTANVVKTISKTSQKMDLVSIGSASGWSAGSLPTLGTAIAADDITAWSAGSVPTRASFNNYTPTVANGTLSLTAATQYSITGVGSVPSLTYTARSIPNVTAVGTLPSLTITSTNVADGTTSADGGGGSVITAVSAGSTADAITSIGTITQPTITLATDTTSGTGKVQVATGISSATSTQPTFTGTAGSTGTPT